MRHYPDKDEYCLLSWILSFIATAQTKINIMKCQHISAEILHRLTVINHINHFNSILVSYHWLNSDRYGVGPGDFFSPARYWPYTVCRVTHRQFHSFVDATICMSGQQGYCHPSSPQYFPLLLSRPFILPIEAPFGSFQSIRLIRNRTVPSRTRISIQISHNDPRVKLQAA